MYNFKPTSFDKFFENAKFNEESNILCFFSFIQYTEELLSNLSTTIELQRKNIDEIKRRWLYKLEILVGNISERFSAFFEHMGYAGEIQLNKGGSNEDDFTNYGI